MAISFIGAGTSTAAATSPIAPDYHASTTTGDYVILVAGVKYATCAITTPTDFTYLGDAQGGLGTDGVADEGAVRVYAFGRLIDGTEGAISVARSGGTLGVLWARTATFRNATGLWSVVGGTQGADNAAGTSVSFTYDVDPGLEVGDWGITCWAVNSSAYTVSTHALTASGLSSVTSLSRINSSVTTGSRLRGGLATHEIVTGTSSGVATYTHTASSSNSVAPTGGSVLVRLREASAGGTVLPVFMHNYRQRRSA